MKIYRQEAYIIFDFEDGKTCKYNIYTRERIGKRNKPVKSLNSQLTQMYLHNSIKYCEDDDLKKILKSLNKTHLKYMRIVDALDWAFRRKYIEPGMLVSCNVIAINNWV